ncbi:hypothetical protein S83_032405 [Arachis hypogaea]|nr:uncharacterized protein DS421_4g120510 [Arachis hypogaea]
MIRDVETQNSTRHDGFEAVDAIKLGRNHGPPTGRVSTRILSDRFGFRLFCSGGARRAFLVGLRGFVRCGAHSKKKAPLLTLRHLEVAEHRHKHLYILSKNLENGNYDLFA